MAASISIPVAIIAIISLIGVVNARYSNKSLEGYSEGFLGDCPNETFAMTKHDLAFLGIVVRGIKTYKRIRYDYYHAHLIAMDKYMDWSKKTAIYIGGYVDSPYFSITRMIENLYHKKGYNFMSLDEAYFVLSPFFPLTFSTTKPIASRVGEMLAVVYRAGVMDPSRVEMTGISMGSHTMGLIAKRFYELTGKKFSRLTGLDPSGPCFRNGGPDDRLDESHGEYVEAIHTNINILGLPARVGHVDFYVNGGEMQLHEINILFLCDAVCSHMKSLYLWKAVLAEPDPEFIAIKCDNVQQARLRQCYDNVPMVTNIMGLNVNKTNQGVFYVQAQRKYPYYMGQAGLKKENEENTQFMRKLFNVARVANDVRTKIIA